MGKFTSPDVASGVGGKRRVSTSFKVRKASSITAGSPAKRCKTDVSSGNVMAHVCRYTEDGHGLYDNLKKGDPVDTKSLEGSLIEFMPIGTSH